MTVPTNVPSGAPTAVPRSPGRPGESGPPPETRAQRVARWVVLLPATLAAAFCTTAALVNDWFWSDLLVYEGRGSFLDDEEIAELAARVDVPVPANLDWGLGDIDALWADVYLVAAPLLVLLVLAAVVGPRRLRWRAAVAGGVMGVVVTLALAVGWFDVQDLADQWEHDARELASLAPDGTVTWYTGTEVRTAALVGLVILLVVDALVLLRPVWSRSNPGPVPTRSVP